MVSHKARPVDSFQSGQKQVMLKIGHVLGFTVSQMTEKTTDYFIEPNISTSYLPIDYEMLSSQYWEDEPASIWSLGTLLLLGTGHIEHAKSSSMHSCFFGMG